MTSLVGGEAHGASPYAPVVGTEATGLEGKFGTNLKAGSGHLSLGGRAFHAISPVRRRALTAGRRGSNLPAVPPHGLAA